MFRLGDGRLRAGGRWRKQSQPQEKQRRCIYGKSSDYLGHVGRASPLLLECAIVRASVIFLLLSGLFLGADCAVAEVIHLKNGRTIYADQVHENGSHLEYEIGEDSYAIPKSAVDRVEAGGVRPGGSSRTG